MSINKLAVKKMAQWILVTFGVILITLILLIIYWLARPNRAEVNKEVVIETWTAVNDGTHNSNTDLISWNGYFYLVHASSPWHFASEECILVVRRSVDGKKWKKCAEIRNPGQDIRDPKFAIINNILHIYVLKNVDFTAEPYTTSFVSTGDGINWSPLMDVGLDGWLFWRPKSLDGKTWYVPAYWHEHGKAALLKTTNGVEWSFVSEIYEGDRIDETAIEFLPDKRMICTGRLEVSDSWFGHPEASTLLGISEPPYTEWKLEKSMVTRLDGPYLFSYRDRIFAVGRHNPGHPSWPTYFGSIFGRKRTSLYWVTPQRLIYISDLPSAGDTAYAGVVIRGGEAFICYYTSNIKGDYPWILGMIKASDIMMARVPLVGLYETADEAQVPE